jgi:hypothetical protein
MIPKHTPGPWHRNIRPAAKYPVVWSGRSKHVLAIKTIGLTDEEIEANINLAAAGPDLLAIAWSVEALLSRQKWVPNAGSHAPESQLLAQVRAALMAATGMTREEWVSLCAQRLVSFGGIKYMDDAIEEAGALYATHTKDGSAPPWPIEAADADIATWKD